MILFCSILSQGAEHDSTAFKNSSLYKWLITHWELLLEKGFYFLGDTAYALRSLLHTPYDGAMHGNSEDNCNFFTHDPHVSQSSVPLAKSIYNG